MRDFTLDNVPNDTIYDRLEKAGRLMGIFEMPNEQVVSLIIDNLKRYHATITLHDFEMSFEYLANSIVEVRGRPGLNVKYISSVIKAYKDHIRKTSPNTPEEELSLEERYGKTTEEMNNEIRDGFQLMVDKYRQDPSTFVYVFYARWFQEVGFNMFQYIRKWSEYENEVKDFKRFSGVYGDVQGLEVKVMGKEKAAALRNALTDFIKYLIKEDISIKSLI